MSGEEKLSAIETVRDLGSNIPLFNTTINSIQQIPALPIYLHTDSIKAMEADGRLSYEKPENGFALIYSNNYLFENKPGGTIYFGTPEAHLLQGSASPDHLFATTGNPDSSDIRPFMHYVVAHELGHGLGLPHTLGHSLMFESFNWVADLDSSQYSQTFLSPASMSKLFGYVQETPIQCLTKANSLDSTSFYISEGNKRFRERNFDLAISSFREAANFHTTPVARDEILRSIIFTRIFQEAYAN